MTSCSCSTCFAPDSTCDLGHLDHTCCSAWRKEGRDEDEQGELAVLVATWSDSSTCKVESYRF
ncbi:hypothetical protein, partial [Xenorhabdus bovienii]|uniref:hypothetical protein n=1 Tax=Xenorhabdus bovienii TaxID=40576 RepID=UPI003DA5CA94